MSELRSRLRTLRHQSGGSDDGALARRLDPIGVGQRRRSLGRPRASDETLASRLGGTLVRDGVVLVRERLPADARHGDYPLHGSDLGAALAYCAQSVGCDPRAAVFMDTETTGLAGGTGTLVFLLGMARFEHGALELSQLLLTGFAGEKAMLEEARAYLEGAETLITFNGRSFDAPLLAARYRLASLSDPFALLAHVDLLHVTRRTFRNRWPDCRLQTAERRLLGHTRIGDLPGCEAPRAWLEWLRHGRDADLAAVRAHNRQDLLSLAVLPAALHRSHEDPAAAGADVLACARHRGNVSGEEEGERVAFEYLARHRAHLETRGLLELARLARRFGEWNLAVEIWEHLGAARVEVAIEHLAKYYEHQKRDFDRALELARQLLECAPHDRRHRRRNARLRNRAGIDAGDSCPDEEERERDGTRGVDFGPRTKPGG